MPNASSDSAVYIVGTADTKRAELEFLRERIAASGVTTRIVDVGILSDGRDVDFGPTAVAAHHARGAAILDTDDRGGAIAAMGEALIGFLTSRPDLAGVIGIGGSGGTAAITPAMQALPIGTPKVMVSTVASGDVTAYVGPTDICMIYSITDLAGLNRISTTVLNNAAAAISGMVRAPRAAMVSLPPAVGLSMFGVTTPLVMTLTERLKPAFEPLVFHATGIGGRSMERLALEREVIALLDMTTTEIADYLVGGVMSAGPSRLDAVIETKLPYIGSCGALDMVNFGARETVPEKFNDRQFYIHNPFVTLMRTTRDENRQIGEWIGNKLNCCEGPVRFLIPSKGVSAIDIEDGPFRDPQADAALFEALQSTITETAKRQLVSIDAHINDTVFADAVESLFKEVVAV